VTDLVAAVCRYADKLHRAVGGGHHVASPLGAWLVLALAAPAATGADRDRLEQILGCDATSAGALARELLSTPHASLRLAGAVWNAPEAHTPQLAHWLAELREVVDTGPVPTQQQADRWAAAKTNGLIKEFPVTVNAETLLVLASAIACAVDWQLEFEVVDATELRLTPAAGFDGLRLMLRDPGAAEVQAIVGSDAGPLGVHATNSADADLTVVSVIAAPHVMAADVLAHAHRIAAEIGAGAHPVTARSLFDLPAGAGPAWTISERTGPVSAPNGLAEYFEPTLLPAWSAESEHDLGAYPDSGFGEAAAVLARLLPDDPRWHAFEAKQVALARYTRTGFEAAAVTGMALRAAGIVERRDGLIRTARLEFVHPYAVVAIARDSGPWAGLPVFSAWVTTPDEADRT
jgi:hypothetical protein